MLDLFLEAPTETIQAGIPRTRSFMLLNDHIVCSISGGADSDCMLDVVSKLDTDKKVRYVFFNTGIEMDATKRHIRFLEDKYGIKIEEIKPKRPVPRACNIYGVPFMSKRVAEMIERLQKHGFTWEDKPFDELYEQFPKCKSALRWWCNDFGEKSAMNIDRMRGLKEFMVENPPDFRISAKCCDCAKKQPAAEVEREGTDITFIGIRKAEGGARAFAYKTCFIDGKHGKQHFPLFWWTDEDKREYEKKFDVSHSDAYSVYGCTRTGCAGCPFGSHFEDELAMLDRFEPRLANAARNIFGKSYEYTRAYRKFKEKSTRLSKPCAEDQWYQLF